MCWALEILRDKIIKNGDREQETKYSSYVLKN